ncbi:cytochrome C oxidase subunit IV [Novosphingobium sp. Rr 2-17]|uniref:cytochrome o ubiquinol oxidase subunit IV n=1 Tax=Novosphingobium sp. Rr 2-17 TaxID=555793 RepID=UPI000269A52D|nr:cytochrome o ubiquinol oxidase subunit IV [Novosphingobium sp. Rr 2-17]EIZ78504.1 cytochrome C oxidase subunit IV [Novosphingobium sp. Rr 2-17]
MSQDHSHSDGHGADGHHADSVPHGSLKEYVIGFVLSVILTVIPFWLVMTHPLSNGITAAIILGFAAVQMVVHMIFFLHMNGKVEGGWSMTALLFTLIVVVIMLSGSLWVMYHLNTNMMPTHDMSQMP